MSSNPTRHRPIGRHIYIVTAWIRGGRWTKAVIMFALLLVLSSFVLNSLTLTSSKVSINLFIAGAFILYIIERYQRALSSKWVNREIERAERRAREHPNEPKAAWDVARLKLESYLNRNLNQIRWIFFLCLLVMSLGFGIISYGIIRVYQSPTFLSPSIVVTVSGVIVEVIGASFLLIYRATMEQAREYVTVLERINAVGMSVQILESIENAVDPELKDKVKADLSRELLTLYGALKKA